MPEKKTTNMLIRAIPMDVWERVDMFCRRQGIKRREFLERALIFFEGGKDREGYEQKVVRAREARLRFNQMIEVAKGYKGIINFKRTIEYVRKHINMIGDRDTEMNILLEVKKLEENLNEIIKEYLPKHEIPEDPEELRKIGLGEYSYVDIPLDYERKDLYTPAHPTSSETESEGFFRDLNDRVHELLNEIKEK